MNPEARKATEMRKNIIIRKQKRDEDQMTRVGLLSPQTRLDGFVGKYLVGNNQGFFSCINSV
jgi:hypothetical protein